jgi:phosphatidylglycerophosphate synthase
MMPQRPASPAEIASQIVGNSPHSIWSLPAGERLRRQLHKAGATAMAGSARLVALLRADWVYDEPIVRGLVKQQDPCSMWSEDGICVAILVPPARSDEAAALLRVGKAPDDLPRRTIVQVAGEYNSKLRKREPPYLLPLTDDNLQAIEARVFAGSYKGVTDFVTLYLWPRPARAVTRLCAQLGLTPNMVTSIGLVLVFVAMWAFWHGHYGWGLVAAWVMTFLDTVDGKLARVTMQSSKFGDFFDHSIDLIHPPFWWWAWVVGLAALAPPLEAHPLALKVILIGYVVQRLEEGLFDVIFKVSPHLWQRFDSFMRLITARRNPNLAILTVFAIAGRPDIGVNVVAVWVAICIVIHAVRMVQAGFARRHGPLRSWLA